MTATYLLLLALATAPQDQWQPFFTLHVENDSFPGAGADDSYTQGLDLHVNRDGEWRWLNPLVKKAWNRLPGSRPDDDDVIDARSFVIGQTIMTPHNVITYTPSPADRPFAAFLFVGAEASRIRNDDLTSADPKNPWRLRPARLTMGVYAGVVGPWALGRDAQSGWHVYRENRLVKGWLEHQLKNEPQLNVRASYDYIPARLRKGIDADLTISEEISLGTTQTYAGIGGIARIGYGLSTFPGTTIGYSAVPSATKPFEIGVQAGARARYMARNTFIAGTFGDPTDLDTKHGIVELSGGLEVRWKEWRLTYLMVNRSQEFSPVPPELPTEHRFVAVNISREQWTGTCDGGLCGFSAWLGSKIDPRWRDLRMNLRFGRGYGDVQPDRIADPYPSLAVNLGAEYNIRLKGIGFGIGLERAGVGREGGPPTTAPEHTDLFLMATPITASVQLLPARFRHQLQLRIGRGSAKTKLQTVPDTGALVEPETSEVEEKGNSVLGGVRYSFQLARPLSLVLDVSRNRIKTDKTLVESATSTAITFGIQIHPWSRLTGQ
jgi:lipid A 3-O-deacylase